MSNNPNGNSFAKQIAELEAQRKVALEALIGSGGYANTSRPSQSAMKAMGGFASIFKHFYKDARPAVERILTLATKADIAKFEERVDAEHWKVIRDELCEMADWYAAHKDADYIDDQTHRPYDEREAYLKHMLDAFERGDRFIVAKLSYDGGEA
ncbi:hypothetical protein [Rhizobium sp. L43]|uniref:hypothetical protein n=1 Tax=Rhizobium sp. L43 TaxID=2035452 RepID=UPI000BE86AF0|nr:hypothetical protein [Rhizobium sp. L43]PDS75459.1 hypothetical protein CO667_26620 [Rhizobium sp. L43]